MIGWRRWAHLGVILAGVVVAYFVVPVSSELQRGTVLRILAAILLLALLAAGVVRQLRRHLNDKDQRVDGLIVSITVAMVVFAFAYFTLQQRDPGQFAGLETRLDALYFTASTAATVGFGDVHAEGQAARALVLVQIAFNVVFVGTAVALLSSRVRTIASARAAQSRSEDKPQ